jgi:hypothetical protein
MFPVTGDGVAAGAAVWAVAIAGAASTVTTAKLSKDLRMAGFLPRVNRQTPSRSIYCAT